MKYLILIFIFCSTSLSWDLPKLPEKYKNSIKRFYEKGKRPPVTVQKQYKKTFNDTLVIKHDTLHVVHHEPPKDTTPRFNFIFGDEDVFFRMVDGELTDIIITDFEGD